MNITEPGIYHIYNRGNNKQRIIFRDNNYTYFLDKTKRFIQPISEIIAWCLMPNHFHFLVEVTPESIKPVKCGTVNMTAISNGFRLMQSIYASGINNQENRTGSLFQQKTRSKLVSDDISYLLTAFYYIHNNPVAAGLAQKPEEWKYSSFRDYLEYREDSICNLQKGIELFETSLHGFSNGSLTPKDDAKIRMIF